MALGHCPVPRPSPPTLSLLWGLLPSTHVLLQFCAYLSWWSHSPPPSMHFAWNRTGISICSFVVPFPRGIKLCNDPKVWQVAQPALPPSPPLFLVTGFCPAFPEVFPHIFPARQDGQHCVLRGQLYTTLFFSFSILQMPRSFHHVAINR